MHLDGHWRSVDPNKPDPQRRTVWRGLATTLGCDPRATPVAYREHEDLALRLREARAVLEALTGRPLELWDSDPSTTWEAVRGALGEASQRAVIQVPDQPSLWPWCDPKKSRTCVMPAVLFGAFACLALEHESKTFAEVIAEQGIDTTQDPWATLAQIAGVLGAAMDPEVPALRDHLDAIWRSEVGTPAPGRSIAELANGTPVSSRQVVEGLRTPA